MVIVIVTVTAIVITIIIKQWEAYPQLDSSDVFGKRERRVWLALG